MSQIEISETVSKMCNSTTKDLFNLFPNINYYPEYLVGKGIPQFNKRSKVSELPNTLWTEDDCLKHTQYLKDNVNNKTNHPMIDDCEYYQGHLWTEKKTDYQLVCLDFDCSIILQKAIDRGFPIKDIPYVVSRTKKLPHAYLWLPLGVGKRLTKLIGNTKKLGDFDIITSVYERISAPAHIPENFDKKKMTMSVETLCYYLDIDTKHIKTTSTTFETKRQEHRNKELNGNITLDNNKLSLSKYRPCSEYKLPFDILKRIMEEGIELDKETLSTSGWSGIVISVAKQVSSKSDANNYIDLVCNLYRGHKDYESQKWEDQLRKYFKKALEDGLVKNPMYGDRYLYDLVSKYNKKLFLEVAFGSHRPLDPSDFSKLSTIDGITVFNSYVSVVLDSKPFYVEYKPTTATYNMYDRNGLVSVYENLKTRQEVKEDIQEEDDDGNITIRTKTTYKTVKDFIKIWLKSTLRKQYQGVCFCPPPMKVPLGHFNLFLGFHIDKIGQEYNEEVNDMSKEELEEELKFLLQHLRYLAGDDKTEEVYTFLLNYFAHLLTFPAVLPRVMVLWISAQGVGKNQWLNFIEAIMGATYYLSTADKDTILGHFNSGIRNRLLINLNELEHAHECLAKLKELTTEKKLTTTEKFKSPLQTDNCCRPIGTTNQDNAFTLPYDDRRCMVNRCSSKPLQLGLVYYNELNSQVYDTYKQKCFMRYCRIIGEEIGSSYNFEKRRPITKEYDNLRNRNTPPFFRFLQSLYEAGAFTDTAEYTKTQWYNLYKTWGSENGEQYEKSKKNFDNTTLSHIIPHDNLEDEEWLEANGKYVIEQLTPKTHKKKQIYYKVNTQRLRTYFDNHHIEYDNPHTDSNSESESEEDN